jgi:hypothetical protein
LGTGKVWVVPDHLVLLREAYSGEVEVRIFEVDLVDGKASVVR